jgi:hypothetical protein
MEQDTGKFRTNTKDQFYTDPAVAKECIDIILRILPCTSTYLWIEPSAGNGSFLHNVPNSYSKLGFDIEPKSDDIQRHDFLSWEPPFRESILVFGNPPFGRQSSLAKAFIRKSCSFANVIAFILPKSFMKPSMHNAFDRLFHCIYSKELDSDSFLINDVKYDVPCVFQIWQKRDIPRELERKVPEIGFQYVKSSEPYDIALRRVGALAGRCYKNDGTLYSVQSHYFLRFDHPNLDAMMEKVNNHVFPTNTVGPRSLSKSEINVVLNQIVQETS